MPRDFAIVSRAMKRPAPNRSKERPKEARASEVQEIVFGFRAAMAVFETRPSEISRIGYAGERRDDVAELADWALAQRVPCDEMTESELARVASSTHHEGLVVRAAPRKWSSMSDFADAMIRARGFAVALDRVRNPYNVGAILRSAAFFGLEGAILGALAPHPALAPDAIRVAEGGAEHLRLARTTDLAETLLRLRGRGLRVIGGESDVKTSLFGYPFVGPTVLVLGHEREGLSSAVRAACDAVVAIPGTGKIESLNVGIAASLCIARDGADAIVTLRIALLLALTGCATTQAVTAHVETRLVAIAGDEADTLGETTGAADGALVPVHTHDGRDLWVRETTLSSANIAPGTWVLVRHGGELQPRVGHTPDGRLRRSASRRRERDGADQRRGRAAASRTRSRRRAAAATAARTSAADADQRDGAARRGAGLSRRRRSITALV